ncbi:60S ribosomal protein L31 [Entophlyctis helioformis]|nr:60S ribosomal protein L31 [Entophlyctis helioformis]
MANEKSAKPLTAITREYTIHLHKRVYNTTFKKRAPKAVKIIRDFASKAMKTTDVRIDPSLNQYLWKRGVKAVPHRIRVRVTRKRNDAEDAKEKMYTYVTVVDTTDFKGLQTVTIDE